MGMQTGVRDGGRVPWMGREWVSRENATIYESTGLGGATCVKSHLGRPIMFFSQRLFQVLVSCMHVGLQNSSSASHISLSSFQVEATC